MADDASGMTAAAYRRLLARLFAAQPLGVLATQSDAGPYASLVAVTAAPDLRWLLFATTQATRKAANLRQHPRAALLIDSRSNGPADFHEAIAVTALGPVRPVDGPRRPELQAHFLARHPALAGFLAAPTTALFQLDVSRYLVVDHFQHVSQLEPAAWT